MGVRATELRKGTVIVDNGQLWLITRQDGESGVMEPVTADTIRTRAAALMNEAVAQTLAARA